MKEPSTLELVILIAVSLLFALAGLYLLAAFSRLFKNSIRNELLRKNVAAWLIIFCLSNAMLPLGGMFFYLVGTYGWVWAIGAQIVSTTLCTLIIYNLVRIVSENQKLKKLPFVKHNIIIFITLVVTTLAINIPLGYLVHGMKPMVLKYVVINSVYLAGATGLVYIVIRYLDIERKRKFDEKELELSRLRELKVKAELDALHSKVNPHFLYNALNSIADLSITDGKKARRMTIALADLFRYSINYSQNNFSTIKDEVAMAEVYLQIEKIRFEDQLSCTIKVDDSLNHFLVPRFVLQPLVENAVKHGLKATGKMTEIRLEVKKHEEGMKLIVGDNGPLFPDELSPGYGVKSVYDKLELLFPENFELSFNNIPQKEVCIYIKKLIRNEPGI